MNTVRIKLNIFIHKDMDSEDGTLLKRGTYHTEMNLHQYIDYRYGKIKTNELKLYKDGNRICGNKLHLYRNLVGCVCAEDIMHLGLLLFASIFETKTIDEIRMSKNCIAMNTKNAELVEGCKMYEVDNLSNTITDIGRSRYRVKMRRMLASSISNDRHLLNRDSITESVFPRGFKEMDNWRGDDVRMKINCDRRSLSFLASTK